MDDIGSWQNCSHSIDTRIQWAVAHRFEIVVQRARVIVLLFTIPNWFPTAERVVSSGSMRTVRS